MSFCLTILGSSSALPTSKRFPTAHVLNVHEHFFLIDCGEGTQIQLRKFRIRLNRINHIFISHLHGDHYYGLPGLISTYVLLGRTADLHIYAPPELEKYIR
jgi:ribonuclease Z